MNKPTDKTVPGDGLFRRNGVSYVLSFILITTCFCMWGVANEVTNALVPSFTHVFGISKFQSSFVQVAFYLGYFVMAFPAAIFIQRHTFKHGVLVGLTLYALGALAFIPPRYTGSFYTFLPAYFIMTCGLSFLETSCNPYVYTMGSDETATRRLNFAQTFNSVGAWTGACIAILYVNAGLYAGKGSVITTATSKVHDLNILTQPYIYIGIIIVAMLICIAVARMPKAGGDTGEKIRLLTALKELIKVKNYRRGVIAQFFYIGAQTVCWSYIIYYGAQVFESDGLTVGAATTRATYYYLLAMALFAFSRMLCTYFLKFIRPGKLLAILAVAAIVLLIGVIFVGGHAGLWCLVLVSACMSLMFPTIYGIALTGIGKNVKFAGAGLVMSILGGSVIPPVQAAIMDVKGTILGLSSVNISFFVPFVCFIVVAAYGIRAKQA